MGARRAGPLADAATIVGLLIIAVGSFLPWLRSGRTTRDGYATGAVARRLLHVDGVAGAALGLVPFAALACAVAVAALLLGLGVRRQSVSVGGRIVAVVVAAGTAVGAFVALAAHPGFGVTVPLAGPVVTIVGAATVWAAVIISIGLFIMSG